MYARDAYAAPTVRDEGLRPPRQLRGRVPPNVMDEEHDGPSPPPVPRPQCHHGRHPRGGAGEVREAGASLPALRCRNVVPPRSLHRRTNPPSRKQVRLLPALPHAAPSARRAFPRRSPRTAELLETTPSPRREQSLVGRWPAGIFDNDLGVGSADDLLDGGGPGDALAVGHGDPGSWQMVVVGKLGHRRVIENGAPLVPGQPAGFPAFAGRRVGFVGLGGLGFVELQLREQPPIGISLQERLDVPEDRTGRTLAG